MSKAVNSPHDRPRTINTAISGGTTMGASRGGRPRSPFTERGTSIHPAKFPSTAITMSEVWRALSRGGYLEERRKEAPKRYMGYGPAFVSEEVVGYPVKPARTLYISQKKS